MYLGLHDYSERRRYVWKRNYRRASVGELLMQRSKFTPGLQVDWHRVVGLIPGKKKLLIRLFCGWVSGTGMHAREL